MRELDEMLGEGLQIAVQQRKQPEPGREHNCSLGCFENSHSVDAACDVLFRVELRHF